MNIGISRRHFLGSAVMGAAAAAMMKSEAVPARKPNFLVIMADDMGYSDAGCYGGEVETVNIDRLAANGLRFTQHYSTGRCWPSRTCLLTGYYPQQVRMDPPKPKLPGWTRVLPHYLKPAGYRCYHSGKWHLMGAPKAIKQGGFDHSYIIRDHDRFFAPKRHELDDEALPPVEEGTDFYLTTEIGKRAASFLEEHAADHADAPFYLYLAFTSPHFPLHALQKDIDHYKARYAAGWDKIRAARYKRQQEMGLVNCPLSPRQEDTVAHWSLSEEELQEQVDIGESGHAVAWDELTPEQKEYQTTKMAIHAAMIHRMDREIGRVLRTIRDMGALENTVVFFVSDNGASAEQIVRGDLHDKSAPLGSGATYMCLGPGWSTAANTPFRFHKSWVHEGGISSPLVVHWPAGFKAKGELRHTPGHFVDIPATMFDLAGVTPEAGEGAPPLPGVSLAPAFAGDVTVPHDFIYWHHDGHRALRVGDWKAVALRAGGEWELYDMRTDRSELRNVAADNPDRLKQLTDRWEKTEKAFRAQAETGGDVA